MRSPSHSPPRSHLGVTDFKVTSDNKSAIVQKMRDYIRNASKPVIVLFYAPWCGHCHDYIPVFHDMARDASFRSVFDMVMMNPEPVMMPNGTIPALGSFVIHGFPTVIVFDRTGAPVSVNPSIRGNPSALVSQHGGRAHRGHAPIMHRTPHRMMEDHAPHHQMHMEVDSESESDDDEESREEARYYANMERTMQRSMIAARGGKGYKGNMHAFGKEDDGAPKKKNGRGKPFGYHRHAYESEEESDEEEMFR